MDLGSFIPNKDERWQGLREALNVDSGSVACPLYDTGVEEQVAVDVGAGGDEEDSKERTLYVGH
jgi:hypothetical protein